MLDYYLKKHCPLGRDKKNPKCNNCVWLVKKLRKCIFSLDFPTLVPISELKRRANMVDPKQQAMLSDSSRRFIDAKKQAEKDTKFWLKNAPHKLGEKL